MAKVSRQRKCLVTGETFPASKLIRFVAGPDGVIVPDVAAKLPGRGCWVQADRDVVEEAIKKKVFLRVGRQLMKNVKSDVEKLEEDDGKKETSSGSGQIPVILDGSGNFKIGGFGNNDGWMVSPGASSTTWYFKLYLVGYCL